MRTIPDGVTGDLNESLRQAAAEAGDAGPTPYPWRCAPTCRRWCRPISAPCSTTCRAAGSAASFVADHDGVGTTLYAAAYDEFAPRFGHRSRQAHLDAGAREVTRPVASLRMDVDDRAALAAAVGIWASAATRGRAAPTRR